MSNKKLLIPLCLLGAATVTFTALFIFEAVKKKPSNDAITLNAGDGGELEVYHTQKVELPYQKGATWGGFYKSLNYIGAIKDGYDFMYWTLDGEEPISVDYVFDHAVTLTPKYLESLGELTIIPRTLEGAVITTYVDSNYGGVDTLKYHFDNKDETILVTDDTKITIPFGHRVSFFGEVIVPDSPSSAPIKIDDDNDDDERYYTAVSGKPISLFKDKEQIPSYGYGELFHYNEELISASGLDLGSVKFGGSYCCKGMFEECTSLIEAPTLSVKELAPYCYKEMFKNCTALKKAPKFEATELDVYCYEYMFEGCTSLVEAPELPIRTLYSHCYSYMFLRCSALKVAPKLPATAILEDADYCYENMFGECTSLVEVADLPATNLYGRGCYYYMFNGCTSLVRAPRIFAKSMPYDEYGLDGMFDGCSSLNFIKIDYIGEINVSNFSNWVNGVSNSGEFYYNGLTTERGSSGIPTNWTIKTFED